MEKLRIVVGITGASGSILGLRLLEKLRNVPRAETHLVLSRSAERTAWLEAGKKEDLTETLVHNLNKTGNPAEMRLCLPTLKGFIILKLEEIVYCEAERSYTIFHLAGNKTLTVSKPLLDYDTLLQDTSFLRIHKSFLINLHHVKEYQRGEGGVVIMSNDAAIEVSRRKKEQFLLKIKETFKY